MALRHSLLLLVLALVSIGTGACGADDPTTTVAASGGQAPGSTTASTAASAEVSTVVPASADEGSGAAMSPVEGLGAEQLKAAVDAPIPSSRRAATGPVVDQITLLDGTRVWRIRIPGSFEVRSARVAVSVGDRRVGEAVLAADLEAITAVTIDGTGLTAGRPVSYQWEGGPSVPAGTLAVVR